MNNFSIFIATLVGLGFTNTAAQETQRYAPPGIDSKKIDWCAEANLTSCGKTAADAFCRSKGHISAQNFYKSSETTRDTIYISTRQRCANPFGCNFFSRIDCHKRDEPIKVNPAIIAPAVPKLPKEMLLKLRPTGIESNDMRQPWMNSRRIDFCISPTGKCGFYTAEKLCRDQGYNFATNFQQARTLRRDTVYSADGATCLNPAGCNWIEKLSCGKYVGTPVTTDITKNERALLVVVSDLSDGYADDDPLADVYNFIEISAGQIASNNLRSKYKETIILKDNVATVDFMLQAMQSLTADRSVQAVDVVFVTHGTDDRIHFNSSNGGSISSEALSARIIEALPQNQRRKLRALFSTACFGASHTDDWLDAGFKTVSGANAVYTDSAHSYLPMIQDWANGRSFNRSIASANKSDHRDVTDSAFDEALAQGVVEGLSSYAGRVDSTRIVKGEGRLTINKMTSSPVLH